MLAAADAAAAAASVATTLIPSFSTLFNFLSPSRQRVSGVVAKKKGKRGMSLSSLLTSPVDVVVVEDEHKKRERERDLLFSTLFFLLPQTINLHQS